MLWDIYLDYYYNMDPKAGLEDGPIFKLSKNQMKPWSIEHLQLGP